MDTRKRGDPTPRKVQSTPPKQARNDRQRTPTRASALSVKKTSQMMEDLRFSSEDDVPLVRKRGEKKKEKRNEEDRENEEMFENECPLDEPISLSAIENYFLKGKAAQQNKSRRRRGKKDKRGDRDDSQEEGEAEEAEGGEEGDGRYAECDLNMLREYHEKTDVSARTARLGELHFNKWTLYLATGFNVLVHGLGSLRGLLHAYAQKAGERYTVVEVEGFRPECTPRAVLNTIYDLLNLKFAKRRSVGEYARQLADEVKDRDVILVVHGIDEQPFRAESDMEVLAILAATKHFKIVASSQHCNRMMLWDMRSIASFCWVHAHVDTWAAAEAEIFAGASSLLGLSAAACASNHTMASLEVLWQSLNSNARSIFHAIFSLVYGSQPDSDTKSVSFWDLFNVAKENFWVSSDAALRQQLVEFCDHRLIRSRRGNDGNERIYPSADRSIIDRFLKEVEMPLEDMQVGGEEEEE